MNKKDPNRFYVYAYLDPRRPGKYKYGKYTFEYEPFYIGRGTGKRDKKHLSETEKNTCNLHKIRKIKKILIETSKQPIIIRIKEKASSNDVSIMEIYLIKTIGRVDLNTGPLTNQTDGGDGGMANVSKEVRQSLSNNSPKIWLGKKFSKNHKNKLSKAANERWAGKKGPMAGKKHSANTKIKMRKAAIGRKHSIKTRLKIGQAGLGRKQSKSTIQKRLASRKNSTGFKHTKLTKLKLSKSHAGKTLTKKHKKNISEGLKNSDRYKKLNK